MPSNPDGTFTCRCGQVGEPTWAYLCRECTDKRYAGSIGRGPGPGPEYRNETHRYMELRRDEAKLRGPGL